ncbi:MAG: hypothetical protein CL482_08600 [Acidobacteria bacterium]|nr:hypothetical protein [Acidobacteriota bacterium]
MNRPPVPPSTSLISLIWSDSTYRSVLSPADTGASVPHQSGASPARAIDGVSTMRSGSPISHSSAAAKISGVGRSAGFPRGAPASAHAASVAMSSSLKEMSSL